VPLVVVSFLLPPADYLLEGTGIDSVVNRFFQEPVFQKLQNFLLQLRTSLKQQPEVGIFVNFPQFRAIGVNRNQLLAMVWQVWWKDSLAKVLAIQATASCSQFGAQYLTILVKSLKFS